MGGLIAYKMGLPVTRFVISVNENDEFSNFLYTGKYTKIVPSRNCISSAMNVGHPSNLSRVVALYDGAMDDQGVVSRMPHLDQMQRDMISYSITDRETEATIQDAYTNYNLLLEPHGSVGWAGLVRFLKENPDIDSPHRLFVSLETAHPAKFPEKIIELLSIDPLLPPSLEGIEEKPESYENMANGYNQFKSFLKENY